MTEKEFLTKLLSMSNNENENIKIKLSEIENRPSVSVQIELMEKKIEQTISQNVNYREYINCKLINFLADGSIEFNPTIIKNYLKNEK
ncbi:hypothetical protein SL053_002443 [Flavobacterium psychrophilum]|nr:hypothetical protein [Flavobacterium psychrophilum]